MKRAEKGAVFVFLSLVSEVVERMLYCFPQDSRSTPADVLQLDM